MAFRQRPQVCYGCPAHSVAKSWVPGEGPVDARLVLVGQGPGESEAFDGRPFVGPAGKKLDNWLTRAGIPRHKIGVGNSVWCFQSTPTERNLSPSPESVAYCKTHHWGSWLASFTHKRVVVCVGVPAMKSLIDPKATASWAGDTYWRGGVAYIGLMHPAAIMRGMWKEEPTQVRTLQRAWKLSQDDSPAPPVVDYTQPPPNTVLSPTLADLAAFTTHIGPTGIAFDLETGGPHIRQINLTTIDTPHYTVVLQFRVAGGGPYWTDYGEFTLATEWLFDLLSDPTIPKWGHNAQSFDVPILLENGFVVEGFAGDTMLASHVALPELPKSLEYLAKLHLGVPGWKYLAGESEGEGK